MTSDRQSQKGEWKIIWSGAAFLHFEASSVKFIWIIWTQKWYMYFLPNLVIWKFQISVLFLIAVTQWCECAKDIKSHCYFMLISPLQLLCFHILLKTLKLKLLFNYFFLFLCTTQVQPIDLPVFHESSAGLRICRPLAAGIVGISLKLPVMSDWTSVARHFSSRLPWATGIVGIMLKLPVLSDWTWVAWQHFSSRLPNC